MNDERLMILQLLQEGKITKEEAEKLLDALNESEEKILGEESKIKVSLSKNKSSNEDYEQEETFDNKGHKSILSELEDGLDIFSDYVNTKINKITEEFSEDKLDSFNKKINNNIERIMNDFSKSSEEISKGIFSKLDNIMDSSKLKNFASSVSGFPYVKEYVKTYNFDDLGNIEIENYYGAITINTTDRNDLSIKIKTKYDADSEKLFTDEIVDELLKIKVFGVTDDAVDVELSLPKKIYENIVVASQGSININGLQANSLCACSTASDIKIDDFYGEFCLCKVQSGNIVLKNIVSKVCELSLINGFLDINNIECGRLQVDNANGRVGISYGKVGEMKVNNSNGRILLDKCNATDIKLFTSNKKIKLETCSCENLNATTSNGDIEIDIVRDTDKFVVDYFTSRGEIVRSNDSNLEIIEDITDYGIRKFKASSEKTNILDKGKTISINAKTSNGSIITNI